MASRRIATRRTARRGLLVGVLHAVILALLATSLPTVAARGAGATPILTLTPASGPCGSHVTIRGAGFPPGQAIDLFARRTAPTPRQGSQIAETQVAADGTFVVELSLLDCGPDPEGAQLTIYAVQRPADPRDNATVLASAVFTLSTAPRCFAETGYCIRGRFLTYWTTWGGLAVNGYPLSDEFVQTLEDGREYTVQYFERVRMEHHPENAPPDDVLLGQFGRRFHPADPPVAQQSDGLYFAATGHNVRGRFAAYWEQYGGLRQFGYPLTEEFEERLEDGKVYTVQYFERARFEHHPENPVPYDLLLGQFGRRILAETTRR
jgi:hypothetical protein